MNQPSPALADLQAWLQDRLMHPRHDSDDRGRSCADVLTPSRRLSPEQRVAVYVNAYAARLVECLRVEFPAVRHAAGEEAFDGFAAGYLQAQPSQSYTLAELGRGFSQYLRATRPKNDLPSAEPDFADFLIDLATLERTYSEVFDAPGPERNSGVTTEQLLNIGPEQFANSRLEFHETVRLLSLRFPCHEYASAVRRSEVALPPAPGPTSLVVFRRRYVVRRMVLPVPQFELLQALREGARIGEALRRSLAASDRSGLTAAAVQQAFAEWTALELIRQIVPETVPQN